MFHYFPSNTCNNNSCNSLCGGLFFKRFIYFIFGSAGSLLLHAAFLYFQQEGIDFHCGVWAPHCDGISCCRAWVLGCMGFSICVRGLSCPKACGIFPDQESNLCPLHRQVDSKPLAIREALMAYILNSVFTCLILKCKTVVDKINVLIAYPQQLTWV